MSAAARLTGQVPSLGAGSERSTVHLLPCAIRHDGAAKVDSYFRPTASGPARGLEAAFRGRLLTGHVIDLAARGIVGALLVQSPASAEVPMFPPAHVSSSTASAFPLVGGKRLAPFRNGRSAGGGRRFGRARASSDDEDDNDDECASAEATAVVEASSTLDDVAAEAFAPMVMRTFELERAFDSATYWLHDTAPGEWDTLPVTVDWFQMAADLHGPVSEAELADFAGAA